MARIVFSHTYTIFGGGFGGVGRFTSLSPSSLLLEPSTFGTQGSVSLATGYEFGGQRIPPTSSEFGFSASGVTSSSYSSPSLRIKYSGYDFTYEPLPSVAPTYGQSTLRGNDVNSGTITSIEVSLTDGRFSGNNGSSNTATMTVTDIAIAANVLDPVNYASMFVRITTGNDQIFGSLLNDFIEAGTGNDQVYGYDGNDRIYGEDGNDYLVGENGDDLLFGGNGSDWIIGGAGNDWLVGNAGYDTLIGGEGNDGIVYDAADNLAGYSGGAGFDILFFDMSGPIPLSFNLAARGFEQANGTVIETGTAAWASATTVYNASWQAIKSEFVNDDGSKSIWRFDASNQQAWNEIRDYYTLDGKLDFEQIYNDDGSSIFIDYDLANTANWFSRTLKADAQGNNTSDVYVFDAVLAQRSAEIGAAPKKMTIDEALI